MFTPSIVLWCVIWLSLKRLGAEEEAWERWQAEASMRRSFESAYRQSRKMEALGNLVGSVAHDFNNLLMIVSTNVQIARRRGAPGLDRELSAIERALKSGQSLTRQLLGVARKQPLRNETIAVERWLPGCRELLGASLGAKVALVVDVSAHVWPTRVDVAELELALINVAVNARDAMPSGGRFTVRANNVAFRHDDGFPLTGDFVQISLEDTGVGMPPEVLQRATEPFFTTKGPGTGLGLAMVHGFVQQSHGRLEIDSRQGEGTTVRMIFPVADNGQDGAGGTDPDQDAAPPGADDLGSNRPSVLVVEDNDDVRELAESVLGMAGYAVQTAASGEQALDLLRQGARVDLLFTDVIMPGGMNGLQLVDEVRRLRPRLPVLVTTGYMDELPGSGQGQRLNILAKPYKHGDLLERVEAALSKES